MKRIVSLVIAVSMVLSVFATVFAATSYSDLTGENAKYAGAVDALSELRVDDQAVINGYPDGTFGPEKTVTRAELAKMLVVCLGLGSEVEALATKTVFSDVPTTHWAAGWINAAAQSKVIVGYPDGSFGPEKTVTYAEAFTMCLRALGYGNVADFEGVWPTAYMLKAVELGLTEDMDGVKADVAATRGNIAILLWNMLRTPMWRVNEESENAGMTLSYDQVMLNVKFPDYEYVDNAYVTGVEIKNNEDVTIELSKLDEDGYYDPTVAQASGIDLTRLVENEKVTALMKKGKKGDDPVFLSITPANELVEGAVEKVDGKKFTVNGVEYSAQEEVDFEPNDFVIFEANGKKVAYVKAEDAEAIKTIPGAQLKKSILIEDEKTAERKIKEDELVIKDGEWITVDDVEVGDIITKMGDWDGDYWQVGSVDSRITGSFESYTKETVKKFPAEYVEIDGERYRNVITTYLKVYEDDKEIALTKLGEKDNKYLDEEVEMAVDFLGNPFILYFESIEDADSDGNFYAVVNGMWTESGKKGSKMVALVGFDGEGASEDEEEAAEGVDFEIKRGATLAWESNDEDLLAEGTPVFVWAKFEDEQIKDLLPLDGLVAPSGDAKGTPEEYTGKYDTMAITSGEKVSDKKYNDVRIPADVPVMIVTPIEDKDHKVVGFAVRIEEGLEDGVELPEGYIAYDNSKKSLKASFVFLAEEARSTEVFYGIVDNYDENARRGINYVTVNGEEYELDTEDEDCITDFEEGNLVKYRVYKDKATVIEVVEASALDDEAEGVKIIGEETETDYIVLTSGDDYDLDEDSDASRDYKNYKVVEIGVHTNKSGDVEFDDVEELEAKGLAGINNKAGVRFIIDDENKTIVVFVGLGKDDEVVDGKVVDSTGTGEAVTPKTTSTELESGDRV